MLFEGIIITGTSCAGKSTIAKELCKISTKDGIYFEQVKAVTTREKRNNDTNYDFINYDFIKGNIFDKLLSNNRLLIDSIYREKKYGIRKSDYDNVMQRKNIPVLVVTPSAAAKLLKEERHMCFFIDAQDEILLDRFTMRFKRDSGDPDKKAVKEFCSQHEKDRVYQDKAHYILNNENKLATLISLILFLWEYQEKGGGLPQNVIRNMIECGILLRGTDLEMIKGASYDLRLGDEYYYGGKIQKLSDKKPFLTIEPYDYAIVSCKETAWMPRDVIAKFGLSVGLFCQGIILSNGPQIDPGFRGTLFCLLFNTSNRAVHLKRGKHYATIEFNKLIGYAEPYEGRYQGKKNIIDYIPENSLHGAINELKNEVEHLKTENRIMQNIYLGVVALMFAIISILLVVK